MRNNQLMVFLSAQGTGDNGMNVAKQNLLTEMLRNVNIPYVTGLGVTEQWGSELSVIAYPSNSTEIEVVKQFAFKAFNQEAIIETDMHGNGYLEERKGLIKRLGRLTDADLDAKDYTLVNGVKLSFKGV